MSEGSRNTQTCLEDQEPSAAVQENRRLREENDRLKREAQTVAQANAHAAQLMVRLEEANKRLAREIEERGQVQRPLQDSERRLHTILDSILTGVLVVDARTHQIVDVNPHAAQMIGLPRDQIVGHVCHCFVCPAEKGRCPVADLDQTVDRSERVLLRADGTKLPILKTVVSSTWDTGEYLIESFVDISRLKQAEQELQESLSLIRATLEATGDGILVVGLDGKVKDFNQQAQRLLRLPDAILKSRSRADVVAFTRGQVNDPDAFMAGVKKVCEKPHLESFDVLEFKDGRVLERYCRPQIIDERVVGQVLGFRDVTERHQADQKQAALLRKVAEINQELSQFAYVVSHDLKTPLRGIKLIAEWLCEDYADKLDAQAKEQMALLQGRVTRMHNLIDGVLQYSRVGRIKEDQVDVNLSELLPMIVDTIAPPAHIEIAVAPGLPTLRGEKTRIIQLFQNLLSNAVKFLDKPQGRIEVGWAGNGEFWRFHVADNGPGIEARHFERIFRIFQTLAPKDDYESTGVGLALVKKIVEMYGGRVWVESHVGQGSTFLFTWPRRPTEVVQVGAPSGSAG